MNEIKTITVQRLSLSTVAKLFFLGTTISFAIIMASIAFVAIFGMGPLSRTPHPLTGAGAFVLLVLIPVVAPIGAFFCGLGHYALMAIGLWIYSLWRPVTITFTTEVGET